MNIQIHIILSILIPLTSVFSFVTVQDHILNCIENIVNTYFNDSRSILVSFPGVCQNKIFRGLNTSFINEESHWIVDRSLSIFSNSTLVQLLIPPTSLDIQDGALEEGYFIFLFSCRDEGKLDSAEFDSGDFDDYSDDVMNVFVDQLVYISNRQSWNSRAKYVVVIPDFAGDNSELFALRLAQRWSNIVKVVNFIILIARNDQADQEPMTVKEETAALDVYTWVPYHNNCGEVDKIILLNQWTFNGRFLIDVDLFSFELHKNFNMCLLNIVATGIEPFVIVKRNDTYPNGSQVFVLEGLGVQLISGFAEKFNLSLKFLQPFKQHSIDELLEISDLINTGRADVITGFLPLNLYVTSQFDFTVTVWSIPIVWLVPCPQKLGRVNRALSIFTISSWLTLVIVLLLSSATLCTLSKYGKEVSEFKDFGQCILSAFVVLLGISVAQMPETFRTRCFFGLYVWYCLAVSMVFQTFFVTYLVEPGFEERIRTVEELWKSKIPFGSTEVTSFFAKQTKIMGYNVTEFPSKECTDSCVEDVLFKRRISTLAGTLLAEYTAKKKGVQKVASVVCYLDEGHIYRNLVMAVAKGNALLPILNEYLRRSVEAGFQQLYWSHLNHKVLLEGKDLYSEPGMYFVFTVDVLAPVFHLHFCGCVLSVLCFTTEVFLSNYCKKMEKI
ncbi:Ionotropic receptor 616 [Blattella germanica]|nr:Ionotropic receptor 616 [Blattella germanica]